jgi:hypothetical protein
MDVARVAYDVSREATLGADAWDEQRGLRREAPDIR